MSPLQRRARGKRHIFHDQLGLSGTQHATQGSAAVGTGLCGSGYRARPANPGVPGTHRDALVTPPLVKHTPETCKATAHLCASVSEGTKHLLPQNCSKTTKFSLQSLQLFKSSAARCGFLQTKAPQLLGVREARLETLLVKLEAQFQKRRRGPSARPRSFSKALGRATASSSVCTARQPGEHSRGPSPGNTQVRGGPTGDPTGLSEPPPRPPMSKNNSNPPRRAPCVAARPPQFCLCERRFPKDRPRPSSQIVLKVACPRLTLPCGG